MNNWISQGTVQRGFPTCYIISDSLGMTAQAVAKAVASAFGNVDPFLEIWGEVTDPDKLREGIQAKLEVHRQQYPGRKFVVYFTVVDPVMRKVLQGMETDNEDILCIDVLDAGVEAIAEATGRRPQPRIGAIREVNAQYFKRIEAVEFTIAHDDGRNPQDLTDADIVLIGVSRSSKTPLSIYLSQMGYKVANIPLDPLTEPPEEVYNVDRTRLFGLMTSPDVLVDIRKRRLGVAANGTAVASSYADYEQVCQDLDKARALMRKLGCLVIHTNNRAIEETAQDILRYYSASHPAPILS